MRFWRGDPAEPNGRVSCPTPCEQLLLDLPDTVPLAGALLRISVTTDEEGDLLQASFVALRHGEVETVWAIPFERSGAPLVALAGERPAGRELPPPPLGLIEDEDEECAPKTATT